MKPLTLRTLVPAATALALTACTSWMPPVQVDAAVPDAWHAPLPHQNSPEKMAQ